MTKPTPNDRATAEQSDVVLFGLDETGKPRAARFSGEHTDLAAKAAGLMNLTICYANSPELATIAQQLPVGRIHANGRGLVPNVRRDLYDKLIEALKTDAETRAPENPSIIQLRPARQIRTPPPQHPASPRVIRATGMTSASATS